MLAATLAGALGAAALAHGEQPPSLRLGDVLAEARERNPEIRAARERARAAAAVPRQVSAYDDPTLGYEAWNVPESLRIDQADNNIFRVAQKLPFPGKRTLAGTVAAHEAAIARRETDRSELDVVADVKRAFYGLWQEHQNLLVYTRERALVGRFAAIAEQRYALGEVSQADVLRAQVDLTRLSNRVTTATLAIDAARAELNALLSRAPEEPRGVPEPPGPFRIEATPQALAERALAARPEIAAQTEALARDQAALRLAHRNYLPDFEVAAARFVNAGQNDGFGAMLSVTIPWAYKAKYDAGVAEARARLASTRAELRQLQDRVRRDVTEAFVRARTALLQNDLFVGTHIPQAEQALRVTESAYRTGAVDFPALIETARTIESVHIEHLAAAAEFERAYADLERAVGTALPRGVEAPAREGGSRE